jgi:hypothetical protein
MTLGNAAAARVRLIVWCRDCQHQAEPDPAAMAERYGAEMTVPRTCHKRLGLRPVRQPAGRFRRHGASGANAEPTRVYAIHISFAYATNGKYEVVTTTKTGPACGSLNLRDG